MAIARHYVEKVSSIEPDQETGIVKLTFAVEGKRGEEEVVQLVISAGKLQAVFQTVGETMQKTFAGGGRAGAHRPGGGGGRPAAGRPTGSAP
ncbi:hypothetical protein, partial [Propylenella binzhouense]